MELTAPLQNRPIIIEELLCRDSLATPTPSDTASSGPAVPAVVLLAQAGSSSTDDTFSDIAQAVEAEADHSCNRGVGAGADNRGVGAEADHTVGGLQSEEEFLSRLESDVQSTGLKFCPLPAWKPADLYQRVYRPPAELGEGHLVVCVHGMSGNKYDLRMIQLQLLAVLPKLDFLMSAANQDNTHRPFNDLTDRFVAELKAHMKTKRRPVAHTLT